MKSKGYSLVFWLLAAAPMVVTLLVLGSLPDSIPAHYGADGAVDRMGSKYETLIIPLMLLIMAAVIGVLMYVYRNNEKLKANQKALSVISLTFVGIFNVMCYGFLYLAFINAQSMGALDVMKITAAALALMFVAIGNAFPKCKQNYVMGIRTTWTLKSEEVWYRTHRFGGKVWVIGGAATLAAVLVTSQMMSLAVVLAAITVLTVIPVVYSWRVYKEIEGAKVK